MNRTLYTVIFYLAMPLVFLRLLWRSTKAPAYRSRWGERLGFYQKFAKKNQSKNIIFHAVSVGEVHAAVPLIEKVMAEYPDREIILTTSTPTGSARVQAIFGSSVRHVYLPYDLPGAVNRFLDFANAELLIILETELWPNLIHYCGVRGIKVMLANARLSAKSFHNYQKIGGLAQQMLSGIDVVAAQSSVDGDGFVGLGLVPSSLEITGSMKFDFSLEPKQEVSAQAFKTELGDRPTLVAGSTREGEEAKVLEAFQLILKREPKALLILVPRHPERFESVAALAKDQNLSLVKRSTNEAVSGDTQVLLGDSMGEMQFYYQLGDIAFVGGSLVDTGCQNIIEPAALALPVLTGPSLFNFSAVSELLIKGGGMQVVQDAQALSVLVLSLFADEALVKQMSQKSHEVVAANQGATESLLVLCKKLLSE